MVNASVAAQLLSLQRNLVPQLTDINGSSNDYRTTGSCELMQEIYILRNTRVTNEIFKQHYFLNGTFLSQYLVSINFPI